MRARLGEIARFALVFAGVAVAAVQAQAPAPAGAQGGGPEGRAGSLPIHSGRRTIRRPSSAARPRMASTAPSATVPIRAAVTAEVRTSSARRSCWMINAAS